MRRLFVAVVAAALAALPAATALAMRINDY